MIKPLSMEEAWRLFDYKDGILYRKVSLSPRTKVGDLAGFKKDTGYIYASVNGSVVGVHRIIYLMHFGYLPKMVDHIDMNRSNNCISNLREATHAENQRNTTLKRSNTSGIKGVSWCKAMKNWTAQICVNRRTINLGFYGDKEFARSIVESARQKFHGEFARQY